MVFLIKNSIDILEGVKILMMITTNFVEIFHEDVISAMTSSQRNDEAKGYWNPG